MRRHFVVPPRWCCFEASTVFYFPQPRIIGPSLGTLSPTMAPRRNRSGPTPAPNSSRGNEGRSGGDGRPAPLEIYRRKRDPERTPEPFGSGPAPAGDRFVIQQHSARNLHFDLRLEMEGVRKSWAVRKGPSVRAEEEPLAL